MHAMDEMKSGFNYTDVVVIGNGPSGICLSYLLSGNIPYYNGNPHPNEFLHHRLQKNYQKPIIDQDLKFLSSGLEGRSSNPLALLFDTLTHPDGDLGVDTPSVLRWENDESRKIKHVVLGRHKAGGSWQKMDSGMQTLSLAKWMELPNLPYHKWLDKHRERTGSEIHTGPKTNRANIQEVRQYYEDYVKLMKLELNMVEGTTVTSVERVLDVCHMIDGESGEQVPCNANHLGKHKWEVRGYRTIYEDRGRTHTKEFCYRAPNVVLATGTFDSPNLLHAPGEQLPYIIHSVQELEQMVKQGKVSSTSDPVLVAGAGLSAADTIIFAQYHNIPVMHVFRKDLEDTNVIFKKLPSLIYPEYHSVHNQMKNEGRPGDKYCALPSHKIVEFMEDQQVIIRNQGTTKCGACRADSIVKVSCVVVQIGTSPDMSFLPHNGRYYGTVKGMAIHPKHNPMALDPFTYQSIYESGLYAMGPLAGDNFVRFLRGGSLAITSHLNRKNLQHKPFN